MEVERCLNLNKTMTMTRPRNAAAAVPHGSSINMRGRGPLRFDLPVLAHERRLSPRLRLVRSNHSA
eukprot:2330915-Rhodomonas_salina.2